MILLQCFFLSILTEMINAQITIFGNPTIGVSSAQSYNGFRGTTFVANQNGTLQSLSVYINTGGCPLILGIYNATGPSSPGCNLLGQASSPQLANNLCWFTQNISGNVQIIAGNSYFLGYMPSCIVYFAYDPGSGGTISYTDTTQTYPNASLTFSVSAPGTSRNFSIYATVSPTSFVSTSSTSSSNSQTTTTSISSSSSSTTAPSTSFVSTSSTSPSSTTDISNTTTSIAATSIPISSTFSKVLTFISAKKSSSTSSSNTIIIAVVVSIVGVCIIIGIIILVVFLIRKRNSQTKESTDLPDEYKKEDAYIPHPNEKEKKDKTME